jgi:DNA-directed RNA polymerase beta' subunit
MTKKILFTLCGIVASASLANAQANYPIDADSKLITYKKVIEVAGTSKADFYNRALTWANAYYKNPGDVLREKDAVAGKIVIKARFKFFHQPDKKTQLATDAGDVMYTLTLEFKDGRFRYVLTNINWQQKSAFPIETWMDKKNQYYTETWDYYLKETDETVKKILADLEKNVSTPPKVKKDDW